MGEELAHRAKDAIEEYWHALAGARKAYDEATALPRKAMQQAVESALKSFQEAESDARLAREQRCNIAAAQLRRDLERLISGEEDEWE